MTRLRLPDIRSGLTRRISINEKWDLYITVNFYENLQPGEVFVHVGKEGTTVNGLVNIVCMLVSMMLQSGIPASHVIAKLRHQKFEPSDATYSSIADAIGVALIECTQTWGGNPGLDYEGKEVK